MATLAAIRAGVQDRLDTISGLRPYEYAQGRINVPAAWVYPEDVTYDTTFDGSQDWALIVDVYVGTGGGMRAAQKEMDGYWDPASATSITKAIDGDKTLGGTVDSTRVTAAGNYSIVDVANAEGTPVPYLTSRFRIEVLD